MNADSPHITVFLYVVWCQKGEIFEFELFINVSRNKFSMTSHVTHPNHTHTIMLVDLGCLQRNKEHFHLIRYNAYQGSYVGIPMTKSTTELKNHEGIKKIIIVHY